MLKHSIIGLMIILVSFDAATQDLGNLKGKEPVKLSGGLQSTFIGYSTNGSNRRDPFSWYSSGALILSLYGWNIPFTFSVSNQGRNFTQPFNRYGIAPSYKWVKVHLGYSSMNFSPYTLSGYVFKGVGLELTPGKWKVSTMYGVLNDAVEEDTLTMNSGQPAFQRKGLGMKLGYQDDKQEYTMILFRSWDQLESLAYIPEQSEVLPQENAVVSIKASRTLMPRLRVGVEVATSSLTNDSRAQQTDSETLQNNLLFMKTRESTQSDNAMNLHVQYVGNAYSIQANYERIDPGYQTHGVYFMNNDLENITVSGSTNLFNNKVNVSANMGKQRNNLADTEVSETERWVYAVNLAIVPSERWQINPQYSNFSSFTNIRPRFDPFFQNELDTLEFYQVNQSGSLNLTYSFGSKERQRMLIFNGLLQTTTDRGDQMTSSSTYQGGVLVRQSNKASGQSISLGVNYFNNQFEQLNTETIGPFFMLAQQLMKKMIRANFSISYNLQRTENQEDTNVFTSRLGFGYTPRAKDKGSRSNHQVAGNIVYLNVAGPSRRGELTTTMTYSYRF